MKKCLSELVGTFILVLFGCGTAVVAGDKVGIVGIAIAFGFAGFVRPESGRSGFRVLHDKPCRHPILPFRGVG